MNMKQELRKAGEAVTPVLCEGAAATWKLCGAARTKLERSVRDCIDRRNQPEMVYISVPGRLREEDIRLMMEAARSVYLSGRIPVCPYLMFPEKFFAFLIAFSDEICYTKNNKVCPPMAVPC